MIECTQPEEFVNKLRDAFDAMAVYKDLKKREKELKKLDMEEKKKQELAKLEKQKQEQQAKVTSRSGSTLQNTKSRSWVLKCGTLTIKTQKTTYNVYNVKNVADAREEIKGLLCK